jgi:hypothetical protein
LPIGRPYYRLSIGTLYSYKDYKSSSNIHNFTALPYFKTQYFEGASKFNDIRT